MARQSRTQIELPANILEQITLLMQRHPGLIFTLRDIREAITMMRLNTVTEADFTVAKEVDAGGIENVVEYSLNMLKNMKDHVDTLRRPGMLIDVLTSIPYIIINRPHLKVLCVGPRTEAEFFMFMGKGFPSDNLTGLDLISYSDFVDVGDMHAMPYADETFDIVFVGWTLTYSKDLQKVANECIRVAKPGAYVAIGVESTPIRNTGSLHGVALQDDLIIIRQCQEILDLFEGHIHSVPFRHEVHRTLRDTLDMVMVIIELK